MVWKLRRVNLSDSPASWSPPDDTVMVKNRHPIRCHPNITLDPRCAETHCELERLDRVLGCIGSRSAMRKADRRPK